MRLYLSFLFVFACCLTGCADIAPAPNADALAKLQSEIQTNINTELSNKIGDVKAGIVTELQNKIDAKIDNKIDSKVGDIKAGIITEMKDVKTGLVTELENVKAGIVTDINNSVGKAEVGLNTKFKALELKLNTSVDQRFKQTIQEMKGEMNIGAFSGGGFYLTIFSICFVVIVFVFLGFLTVRLLRWKTAFEGLTKIIEEHDVEEHARTVDSVKKNFSVYTNQRGITKFVDKELKRLGLMD